jgi:predicted nucleotidyltransferase
MKGFSGCEYCNGGKCLFEYKNDRQNKGCRPPQEAQEEARKRMGFFYVIQSTLEDAFLEHGIAHTRFEVVGSVAKGLASSISDLDIKVTSKNGKIAQGVANAVQDQINSQNYDYQIDLFV